jgi:uncharacterized membrane protein YgdD (TMEM256/DUF423 family)
MARLLAALAGLAGLVAVAVAAVGAHVAAGEAERRMLESVASLAGWHAPALLALGLWADRNRAMGYAGLGLAAGLALFCGAVLYRALAGVSLDPLAPIGGTAMMLGWVGLGLAALRR